LHRKRHHITAFILTAAIALPLLCILFLQGWQCYLKRSTWERLEAKAVQTITVPLHEVHWEKKGKEIIVHGKLFDVKAYAIKESKFIATGVYDEAEIKLAALLNRQTHHHQSTASIIQLLLVGQCFAIMLNWLLPALFYKRRQQTFYFPFNRYRNPLLLVAAPPPWQ
jgi:hypothetical protein